MNELNPLSNKDELLDIPYELVPLPSEGKLYPEGHPLRGKDSVEIKAMTAEEENILVSPALIKKGTVTKELVRACLSRDIDQDTLLVGDKNAILFAIRISGFGPEYKVMTKCPNCDEKFLHIFDLSAVRLKKLPKEAKQVAPGENLFEYILPLSKAVVHFSFLTDKEDDEIRKISESRKLALRKRGLSTDVDTFVTDRLIKQIKCVNGNSETEFIGQFVKRMKARDSRSLREHINKIEPNIEMKEEIRCSNCGSLEDHIIPITTEFFWPELD